MSRWWQNQKAYKLAWTLVCFMALTAFVDKFLAVTETWSDSTWASYGWFMRVRMLLNCVGPACLVVIAFLNTTVAEVKKEVEEENTTTVTEIQTHEVKVTPSVNPAEVPTVVPPVDTTPKP